ncbi:hypothetical protein DWY99_11815 [[Clostridium] leptum]|uniref:Uncharacterized protein n=1 Tax=[Clostridium] leptum TaxID=1535 RepID=A0A412AUZ7_9FIRM|nr:hypothetical protein DWY99_11815 [[Clostridium] leptum]
MFSYFRNAKAPRYCKNNFPPRNTAESRSRHIADWLIAPKALPQQAPRQLPAVSAEGSKKRKKVQDPLPVSACLRETAHKKAVCRSFGNGRAVPAGGASRK